MHESISFDLEPASFIQPYNQKFGGNDEPDSGILFTKPRFQIVFETAGLLEKNVVDEKTGANKSIIIGSLNPVDNLMIPAELICCGIFTTKIKKITPCVLGTMCTL